MGGFESVCVYLGASPRSSAVFFFSSVRLPEWPSQRFSSTLIHQLLSHCWRCSHSMRPFDLKSENDLGSFIRYIRRRSAVSMFFWMRDFGGVFPRMASRTRKKFCSRASGCMSMKEKNSFSVRGHFAPGCRLRVVKNKKSDPRPFIRRERASQRKLHVLCIKSYFLAPTQNQDHRIRLHFTFESKHTKYWA